MSRHLWSWLTVRGVFRWVLASLVVLPAILPAQSAPEVRIAMVVDGPWVQNESIRESTIAEIEILTRGEFDVRFPVELYVIGDWTYATAQRNLEQLLSNDSVDLVITWGVLSSHAVCCAGALPKPVVAPVVLDAAVQNIPIRDGASGVQNLNFVVMPNSLAEELAAFRKILPFRRVAVLGNGQFFSAIPRLALSTFSDAVAAGFDVVFVPTAGSADEILDAVPEEVDAVYVWPQFQLSAEESGRLIDSLSERRLPTFSALGEEDLERGMLATATAPGFFDRLARRVALNVQRILLGEPASDIPVSIHFSSLLTINMETARRIGVSPTWESMVEAELLHPEPDGLPERTLQNVIREAVELNLDLVAQERAVRAGLEEISIARSELFPQVQVSALGTQIDSDRAESSLGSQAETTLTSSLTLDQVIYSDPVRANVAIQRYLQEAREEDFETLRLDIGLESGEAFLNFLRAKTLVQVQRNNLRLTRSNLELARVRRRIGAAGSAEVFRWESQIATDRRALIQALADAQVARIAVNRLLHRAPEELFLAQELTIAEHSILGADRFRGYVETPDRFLHFRDFVVAEGLENAPEIRQLRAQIEAQKRDLVRARRSFWSPQVGIQATLDEILSRSGAGSDGAGFSLGATLPQADDTNWSLGLSASLPLFQGGARRADQIRAEETLRQLDLTLTSTMEKIEQRIRSQALTTRAAFAAVELTETAAEAARKNLDLVADSYSRGAVSILDLLDAQSASFNSDLQATDAVFDFFVELLRVQRAGGRFDALRTPEQRAAWFDRLEKFFRLRGISGWDPQEESP